MAKAQNDNNNGAEQAAEQIPGQGEMAVDGNGDAGVRYADGGDAGSADQRTDEAALAENDGAADNR